jgi:hypothetical protein
MSREPERFAVGHCTGTNQNARKESDSKPLPQRKILVNPRCLDCPRALGITPLPDLYSMKDSYISLALTNAVSLTWLSEQTGVAVATILRHYGRFVHSSEADALELAKIAGSGARTTLEPPQFEHRCSNAERFTEKTLHFFSESLASPTGFEPVLPT